MTSPWSARTRSSVTPFVPILKAASIAWFGTCCAATPDELTYSNSFPLGSSLMYAVGLVQRAVQDGCKKLSSVVINGAQPYIEPMDNALKALGKSWVRPPIILPQTSTDDSSYVAQATSGSDCIVMIVSETLWKPWFAAYQAAGATQRLYGPQGNLDSVSIQGFQSIANGDVIAGRSPTSRRRRGRTTGRRWRPIRPRPPWTTTLSAAWEPGRLHRLHQDRERH